MGGEFVNEWSIETPLAVLRTTYKLACKGRPASEVVTYGDCFRLVQGLLENKDTHLPCDGPLLLGLALL